MRFGKAVGVTVLCLWAASIGAWANSALTSSSDDVLKHKVVQLAGTGYCTGVQISAPSGKTYVLSAGHCGDIAIAGVITAFTEQGDEMYLKIIAEDKNSDLLLLEGVPGLRGLSVAESSQEDEHVRTFGRGKQSKAYVGSGKLGPEEEVRVPMFMAVEKSRIKQCTGKPKFHLVRTPYGPFCVMQAMQGSTSALVIPGSSGGPVINDSGEVVGIMSTYAVKGYGTFVRIQEIMAFLHDY